MEKYDIIVKAQKAGSTAKTKAGAMRYLLAAAKNDTPLYARGYKPRWAGDRGRKYWDNSKIERRAERRARRIIKIINSGELTEIDLATSEYLRGHRTPTEYWRKKTNERMEAARTSHALCDISGEEGHVIRQNIRRDLRNKNAAL